MDHAETTDKDRKWAMLAHALTLCGLVIPLADLLAPVLVGRLGRQSAYVRFHARASLCFQVSCLLYELAGLGVLAVCYPVVQGHPVWPFPGFRDYAQGAAFVELLCLLWIMTVTALVVQASVQARAGVQYRYPLTLRCLK